jgi:hypothetical protein
MNILLLCPNYNGLHAELKLRKKREIDEKEMKRKTERKGEVLFYWNL